MLHMQIEFLEVRLAEVMAYADIPINMRPALTELNPNSLQTGFSAVSAAGLGQVSAAGYTQHLMPQGGHTAVEAGAVHDGDVVKAVGVAGGIRATQVELVRGALLSCLKMLRQMSEALGEQSLDPNYQHGYGLSHGAGHRLKSLLQACWHKGEHIKRPVIIASDGCVWWCVCHLAACLLSCFPLKQLQ